MPVQAVALLDPRFQADHLVAVLVPLHLHDARITFQHLDLFAKLAQFLVGMVAFLGVCGVHFEVRNLGRKFAQGGVLFGNLTFQIGNAVLVVAFVRFGDLLVQVLDTAVALGDLFVGRGEFAFLLGKLALEVLDLDFKFCLCGHGGLLCCNAATLPQPCRSCL